MRVSDLKYLSHDVAHGYIPFGSSAQLAAAVSCQRQVIDHSWVKRLRPKQSIAHPKPLTRKL
jgi:hypothetical protein